ncbi:uroporphyrinogen-III synthase [Saliphagus sp. LR7]|uniref:uroporphyrinogen-III synthase n=1 Tax=Saliphagus sp. LR7 TaxID=2282654 RepID=UPI000DF78D74|nr:uroporphyrinogen-III synthase [Saliphagus sp. LR7]
MRDLSVAVFRPDDGRLESAVELIDSLGARAIADPMLAVEPTGAAPREDADYAILTSKTGAELVADAGWDPGPSTVVAIGPSTGDALGDEGYEVGLVPGEYSSTGLVEALGGRVPGTRVEVARSDHGSPVLTDGLEAAGAYVHETVLYRLVRPEGSGISAERAAAGDVDAAAFTSSLTVDHFLEAAADRGVREEAIEGLSGAVVGAIGEPTRETAESYGIGVEVVPEDADAEQLLCAVVERAAPTRYE